MEHLFLEVYVFLMCRVVWHFYADTGLPLSGSAKTDGKKYEERVGKSITKSGRRTAPD